LPEKIKCSLKCYIKNHENEKFWIAAQNSVSWLAISLKKTLLFRFPNVYCKVVFCTTSNRTS